MCASGKFTIRPALSSEFTDLFVFWQGAERNFPLYLPRATFSSKYCMICSYTRLGLTLCGPFRASAIRSLSVRHRIFERNSCWLLVGKSKAAGLSRKTYCKGCAHRYFGSFRSLVLTIQGTIVEANVNEWLTNKSHLWLAFMGSSRLGG